MADERDFIALVASDAGVSALVSDRIDHLPAPQDITTPYITYFLVNATPAEQITGIANSDRMLIQLDIFADDVGTAKSVADAVRSALEQAANVQSFAGMRSGYEEAADLHRVSMDYVYHAQR